MTEVYLGEPPAHIKNWIIEHSKPKMTPLCFTAQEDGSRVVLEFANYGEVPDDNPPVLQYSMNDTENWQDYRIGYIIQLAKDAKVFFKAKTENARISAPPLDGPPMVYAFTMTGTIAASGNIQSLLDQTCERMDVPAYCYYNMFDSCISLTQAPELPATILADNCYESMFLGCTSLTQAPELPATILADNCYIQMFQGCTALTQAPALPATTLAGSCYADMFQDCTALTQAPALPATTLAGSCYSGMFYNCSNINSVDMKKSVEGVYSTSTHGKLKSGITINYVLD